MELVQIGVGGRKVKQGSFKGGKHDNQKTGISFDTTTICPLIAAGNGCDYCYVTHQRNGGYHEKAASPHDPYDGWVLRLRQETIDTQNAIGGVRMFAFADYVVAHRNDVARFLEDCHVRGLMAKAITKMPSFIYHFHDHPSISVINISIDSANAKTKGKSPISFDEAKRLKSKYDKVRIRCVILNDEEAEFFGAQDWVDILTFNHAANGYKFFTHEETMAADKRWPGRVCAAHMSCVGCENLCGAVQYYTP